MMRTLRWVGMAWLAAALFLAGAPAISARAAGLPQPVAGQPATAPDTDGRLEARIVLLPLDDPGRFDLVVSDELGNLVASASDLGDGGTTGPQTLAPGAYSITVAGGSGTSLGLYITTIACLGDGGYGPTLASCAHCATLDGILVGSDSAVVCTVSQVNAQPPLAVAVAQFEATCQGETPLLAWVTEQEIDIQGFNLYRGPSAAAPNTQLTSSLIPASAPGSVQGAAYTWSDGSAAPDSPYAYWLEVIALDGASTLLPPVTVTCLAPTAVRLAQLDAGAPPASLAGWTMSALALLTLPAAARLLRRRNRDRACQRRSVL